jgi:hypothetical protein
MTSDIGRASPEGPARNASATCQGTESRSVPKLARPGQSDRQLRAYTARLERENAQLRLQSDELRACLADLELMIGDLDPNGELRYRAGWSVL